MEAALCSESVIFDKRKKKYVNLVCMESLVALWSVDAVLSMFSVSGL